MRATMCLILIVSFQQATAQQAPWTRESALVEAESEAASCAAYYAIGKQCAILSEGEQAAGIFEASRAAASRLQELYATSAGMLPEAALGDLKMAMTGEMERIRNKCFNISILFNRYAQFCKIFVEQPSTRLNALLAGPLPPP